MFLGSYTTLVQSCMSYGSLTLSQSTPCRLSVYAIGPKLCKYSSNLPIDRLNKHIDIEPRVIYTNIGSMPRVCLGLAAKKGVL